MARDAETKPSTARYWDRLGSPGSDCTANADGHITSSTTVPSRLAIPSHRALELTHPRARPAIRVDVFHIAYLDLYIHRATSPLPTLQPTARALGLRRRRRPLQRPGLRITRQISHGDSQHPWPVVSPHKPDPPAKRHTLAPHSQQYPRSYSLKTWPLPSEAAPRRQPSPLYHPREQGVAVLPPP